MTPLDARVAIWRAQWRTWRRHELLTSGPSPRPRPGRFEWWYGSAESPTKYLRA